MKVVLTLIGTSVLIIGGQFVYSSQHRPANKPNPINQQDQQGNQRGLWGACCLEDGTCQMEYATQCYINWGGTFIGGECSDDPCPDPMGACCDKMMGTCSQMLESDCLAMGNYFIGGAVSCEDANCSMVWGSCCLTFSECIHVENEWECYEVTGNGTFAPYSTCAESSCPAPCTSETFFSSNAYPITLECGSYELQWGNGMSLNSYRVDLNKSGSEEFIQVGSYYHFDPNMPSESNNKGLVYLSGVDNVSIKLSLLLDLNPAVINYEGLEYDDNQYIAIQLASLFDITGDGLPDAVIQIDAYLSNEPGDSVRYFYYVENISTPPAVACATDVNSDGETDTADILALLSGWGPCE